MYMVVTGESPEDMNGPHKDDLALTSFVPKAGYHALIEAFGGKSYLVRTPDELKSSLLESFSAQKSAVINIIVDPILVQRERGCNNTN
ncbi:2-hydroxyacyl-CoA lyase [Arachis hypogaea]|nr:2-hydroxyacyl-CoA lyase [Arachis hypogaea]